METQPIKIALDEEMADIFKQATGEDGNAEAYDLHMGILELSVSLRNINHDVEKSVNFLSKSDTTYNSSQELVFLIDFRMQFKLLQHGKDPEERTLHETRGDLFMRLYKELVDIEPNEIKRCEYLAFFYDLFESVKPKLSGPQESFTYRMEQIDSMHGQVQCILERLSRTQNANEISSASKVNIYLESKIVPNEVDTQSSSRIVGLNEEKCNRDKKVELRKVHTEKLHVEGFSVIESYREIINCPLKGIRFDDVITLAGGSNLAEGVDMQDTPKRARTPNSPSGSSRKTPPKRTKADRQLLCAGKLTEIGLVLDQLMILTNVKQVRHINVQMKAMFAKMKALQEDASRELEMEYEPGNAPTYALPGCPKCGGSKAKTVDKLQQTNPSPKRVSFAQTDVPYPSKIPKQHSRSPGAAQVPQRVKPREKRASPPKRQAKIAEKATAQQAETQSRGKLDAWTKVEARKKARLTRRPDAVIVEAKGKTYSEVLALVTRRSDGQLQELEKSVHKVRCTASGSLLLELNRDGDRKATLMKSDLEAVLDGVATVRALSKDSRMQFLS
ncbi:uncharacterized protein Dere_GG26222, partial [Drosophila erecta]